MTPLIKVVLNRMNFRMNTSVIIGHPADESFIKYLLKWLHQHNEVLIVEEITQWAIKNNWSESHIEDIGCWAKKIIEGKPVTTRYVPSFTENYFSDLLVEARNSQL